MPKTMFRAICATLALALWTAVAVAGGPATEPGATARSVAEHGGGDLPGVTLGNGVRNALGLGVNASGGVVTSPVGAANLATGAAASNLGFTPAHSGSNSDITSIGGLTTPLSTAQGGTGVTTMPDDLSIETTRPYVYLDCGQSNAVGVGEFPDGVTTVTSPTNQDNIWVYDDRQNLMVRAQYGVYPFTQKPPGSSAYAASPGLEAMKALRAQGILQASRPIYLVFCARGGKSIANFAGTKNDKAGARTDPTAMTIIKSFITLTGVTKIDLASMIQSEADGTTAVADTFSGNAFTSWGYGNTATSASFTATIAGNTLSVPSVTSGAVAIGQTIAGPGVTAATIASGSGTTWTITGPPQTVSSPTAMTSSALVVGPYTSQATIDAVNAAGGFNTQAGYTAATSQFITNVRSLLPGSPNVPVLWAEGNSVVDSLESARNDAIRGFPTLFSNFGLISTARLVGSELPTNYVHYNAPSSIELGQRIVAGALQLYRGQRSAPALGPGGGAVTTGRVLRITNNLDQDGVSNSINSDLYAITADNLRQDLYLYVANSSVYLPMALLSQDINVHFECWSGTCTIYSSQLITGFPGASSSTTTIYTRGYSNGVAAYSYNVPSGQHIWFNTGRQRYAFMGSTSPQGLYRGSLFGTSSGNVGTNAVTAFLSGQLVTSNLLTLTYTVSGTPYSGSATFDGSTNLTSDGTIAAAAAALQTALAGAGAGYYVDAIPGATINAVSIMGPASGTLTVSVTGGASQATAYIQPNVYGLAYRHLGQVWSATQNVTYVLPSSNGGNPGDIGLVANGGGGTAGPITIDTWGDSLLDTKYNVAQPGNYGAGQLVRLTQNQTIYLAPDAASRWVVKDGSYLATPNGLQQGGSLTQAGNVARITLSAALVTVNTLGISGTANNGSGSVAIAAVSQPFFSLSSTTLGLAAKALQTSLQAVIPAATATPVFGQNVIQIDLPSGASVSLSGSVTGGASQATVTVDTGIYSLSPTQAGFDYYLPSSGITVSFPSPNSFRGMRIGLNAVGAASPSTLSYSSGLLLTHTGQAVSSFTQRPGQMVIFEAVESSRWAITGGNLASFAEVSTGGPNTTTIPTGVCRDWNNTTAATVKKYCNIGGTLVSYPNVITFSAQAPYSVQSATVAGGNSGGTNGACTLTVSGGTYSSQATLTGTVSGNAIGTLSVGTAGSYTVMPGSTSVAATGCGFGSITLNLVWAATGQTYTPTAGAAWDEVIGLGAGSGGGGGGLQAAGAAVSGGSGGSGGGSCAGEWQVSALGGAQAITVGIGGGAGAAASSNSTAGGASVAGGNTMFGSLFTAYGAGASSGGQLAAASASGGSGSCLTAGGASSGSTAGSGNTGGVSGASGTNGSASSILGAGSTGGGGASAGGASTGGSAVYGPSGGGSGAGVTSGNVAANGANSGNAGLTGTSAAGGSGAGAAGNAPASTRDLKRWFGSGGAGGASSTTAAFAGGAGALGAGGGGGGSSQNGGTAGAGGAGGNGVLIVIEHAQ